MMASLIFAAQNCGAQNTVRMDAVFWTKLPLDSKLAFAEGFIAGYDDGFIDGRVKAVIAIDPSGKSPKRQQALHGNPDNDPNDLTFGQLVAGIDSCYKDFRNNAPEVSTCADWAVQGIEGVSDASREAFLERERRIQANATSESK
jgi:hypothetical protein